MNGWLCCQHFHGEDTLTENTPDFKSVGPLPGKMVGQAGHGSASAWQEPEQIPMRTDPMGLLRTYFAYPRNDKTSTVHTSEERALFLKYVQEYLIDGRHFTDADIRTFDHEQLLSGRTFEFDVLPKVLAELEAPERNRKAREEAERRLREEEAQVRAQMYELKCGHYFHPSVFFNAVRWDRETQRHHITCGSCGKKYRIKFEVGKEID
jgi:hypothetical protein